MSRLGLDKHTIDSIRGRAGRIVDALAPLLKKHTTVTVERAVLRLMGLDGANAEGVPYPNVVVQHLRDHLHLGAAPVVAAAMLRHNTDIASLARSIDEGSLSLEEGHGVPEDEVDGFMAELAVEGLDRIRAQVARRNSLLERFPSRGQPWLYVIVATGNIYEDVEQARAAALKGADIIAVIRTTGQSLLDYIPYGPTTEGFGGTYATQENFRIMRAALDEVSEQTGHYVRLVNYASGLCMPEIVVTGAFERLDMMLNDSMYGILFRDINPIRTFVDQYFSRVINAAAEIIINTGEDNYLTTADAVESAHTVLASDCINEAFGFRAGLGSHLLGLGHAFEMDPSIEDGFLMELGQAMMLREIFPDSPLKYMPPTKFMSGDIFKGYIMNAMFNLAGVWSGQGIQLLGMLTEAMHTPFIQDRYLGLENARYIMNTARSLSEAVEVKKDGPIARRAQEVLAKTEEFLSEVEEEGLLGAIAGGKFADIGRSLEGGKGLSGVVVKGEGYRNPFVAPLGEMTGLKEEIHRWM